MSAERCYTALLSADLETVLYDDMPLTMSRAVAMVSDWLERGEIEAGSYLIPMARVATNGRTVHSLVLLHDVKDPDPALTD